MSTTRPPKRTGRSILAVVLGFLAVVIPTVATDAVMHATGVFPPEGSGMTTGLWVLALTYRCIYQVLGGYVTARLAPDRPMRHAWILVIIGCAIGLAGVILT